MDLAVETVVEIAIISATGLHDVALHAAAGSPWNVRGNPWKVCGCPWSVRGCPSNAVVLAVECRGGPWTLPRCAAERQIMYTPLPYCEATVGMRMRD